ncbi:TonB-dependent receptor [Roseateles sp. YR242]|uniref:TonB-dependent receptor n=1 Tax=Roseateles sp. YR242 TaxID=1855305 RepID=UPI0008D421AB|nr:TonB-dependent receptor [Roseateles sp. YR242]SEL37195.1 TonB-dependent receptor [Roseateles sp. YR242]
MSTTRSELRPARTSHSPAAFSGSPLQAASGDTERDRGFALRGVTSAVVILSCLMGAGSALAQAAPAPAPAPAPADAPTPPAPPAATEKTALDTVVVTGMRKSAESAQTIKQNSDQVVDSIVAEDIGKFPDKNVAELLGRVTGVQIQRGNGEAGTVIIRGLGGIVTLLNGREFFSDSGRSLYLADVPATMLNRIDVYKTQEASLPEGGTAGVIDVRTNRPFDFKDAQLFINARGERRDKAKTNNPDLSTMASNRWKTDLGEMGALIGLSYQRGQYHDERAFVGDPLLVTVPGRQNQVVASDSMGRVLDLGDRRRVAGNFALQWKPSKDAEVYLEGFATKINHRYQQSFLVGGIGLVNDPNLGWIPADGSVITTKPGTDNLDTITNTNYPGWGFTSTQAKHDDARNMQLALGGTLQVNDKLKLKTELAHTHSKIDWVNRILDTGYNPTSTVASVKDSGGFIDYPGLDLTNPANFHINGGVDVRGVREGNSTDWRGDADYDLGDGFFKEFSTGLRLAKRDAMAVQTNMAWTTSFSAVGQSLANFPGIWAVSPSTWGDFGVKQYAYASRDWLLDNGAAFREMLTGSTDLTAYDPTTRFDDTEKTSSAYGRLKFGFDLLGKPITGVAGLRLVHTSQVLRGNSKDNATGTITPVNIDTSRTDALPTISLRAELTPRLIGRLVWGKTIERPAFSDYNPATTVSPPGGGVTYGTIAGGNPDLKPTESNNTDVALEWYFTKTGAITGTLFDHKFKNRVMTQTTETTIDDVLYRVTKPVNLTTAELHGYELGYRQFYDFLPGWLSGFGLEANFTFMTGSQTDAAGNTTTFLGQSRKGYNVVGLYERNNIYGRLAYNWRSKFLAESPYRTTGRELWVAPLRTLDASIGYNISKQLTVSLDVTNLLNQAYHDYFDSNPSLVRDVRYYDRTVAVGLRWKM